MTRMLTIYLQGPTRQYGFVTTSSPAAIRLAMHAALDEYLDELEEALGRNESFEHSPLCQVRFELRG